MRASFLYENGLPSSRLQSAARRWPRLLSQNFHYVNIGLLQKVQPLIAIVLAVLRGRKSTRTSGFDLALAAPIS